MHQLYPSVSAVKQAPTHLPALIYIRDGRAYGWLLTHILCQRHAVPRTRTSSLETCTCNKAHLDSPTQNITIHSTQHSSQHHHFHPPPFSSGLGTGHGGVMKVLIKLKFYFFFKFKIFIFQFFLIFYHIFFPNFKKFE